MALYNQSNQHKTAQTCQFLPAQSSVFSINPPYKTNKMQSIIPEGKVHFYEYMQVELLQEYIQKGLTYFINALLNASPRLTPLRYYSQEIALVVNFLKDWYYLRKHKATYAEYFFGLERERLGGVGKGVEVSSRVKAVLSAVVMTVVPYLVGKIDAFYNTLVEKEQNEGKVLNNLQKLFTKAYPYLYALLNIVQVIMKFKFLLFQKVRTYDLYYKLSDATLNYIEQDEQASTHYPWMQLIKTPGLLSVLVGHKVLTWYFNQKNYKKSSQRKIDQDVKYTSPLTAAKGELYKKPSRTVTKLQKNSCPICSNDIDNPTVVKRTGHVYCYECISEYVKENQTCPLTGLGLTADGLQLVYSAN